MQTQMNEDAIDVLTDALPDTLSPEFFSTYKKYNFFPLQKSYKNTFGKIVALTNDSAVLKHLKECFEPAINEIMIGKPKKVKDIEALPCPKSFQNAFENFLKESPLAPQLWKQAFPHVVKSIEHSQSKDYHHRSQIKSQYIENNVPVFWQNVFVGNSITEQDLEALTPPTISKKERQSINALHLQMVRLSKDIHIEILRRFSVWYSKWSKDENEDRSILSYIPSIQDMRAEEQAKDNTQDQIFEKAVSNPYFPGGKNALLEFLGKNMKYPSICQELGIQSRVYASFVVEKDGSIIDIKIMRSPHPAMSKEVERLLGIMPPWAPGIEDGKPVRVKYSVPIMFRLK